MNANMILDQLLLHPVFLMDLPENMKIGLPMLERKNGRVLIRCRVHEEKFNGDNYEIYPAAAELNFDLDTLNLLSFHNYMILDGADVSRPVASPDGDYMSGSGKDILDEVIRALGETLEKLDAGEFPEDPVAQYQEIFYAAVRVFGLEALYPAPAE